MHAAVTMWQLVSSLGCQLTCPKHSPMRLEEGPSRSISLEMEKSNVARRG